MAGPAGNAELEAPAPAHAMAEPGPLHAPEQDPGAGSAAAGAEQPLLLVTTVSISGDVSDRIELRLGDCPLVQAPQNLWERDSLSQLLSQAIVCTLQIPPYAAKRSLTAPAPFAQAPNRISAKALTLLRLAFPVIKGDFHGLSSCR